MPRWVKTLEQRFWDKVGPHGDPTKCWLWMVSFISKGGHLRYGVFWDGGKQVLAHRFSYELHYGVKIPPGMTIDHVKEKGCTDSLCVNPRHLEVVTNKVNILRGDAPSAKQARQIMCVRGHPFDEENTYVKDGHRDCRTCHREDERRRSQERRSRMGIRAKVTHCPQGHPYDEENTYVWRGNGSRGCRTCRRDSRERYRKRYQEEKSRKAGG